MSQTASYLELSYWQVGLATLLILFNGALSLALRLGLGKRLFVASVRTTVQLLLVGLVLQQVFALRHWAPVIALAFVMVLIAGIDLEGPGRIQFDLFGHSLQPHQHFVPDLECLHS